MAEQSGQYSGQTFGNYRLIRLLGRGGFAEVYLSQHIYLNTHAAIKALHTQLNTHEQEYFLNEARTIARLIHPHIIRVLDFGMQYEVPYLVMDYAPNGSLRDRHPKGSILPLGQVISYVQDVASALQYAHNEKLIHRDIKPENMLVGNNSTILLSDFGISAIAHTTQSQHLQEVVGTVPYMAPEQLEGKPRAASDQYSLAITVFEWLNGDRPFQGSFTEIYSQQMFTPPPSLRIRNPSIPPAVEQVIITALSKDPHQRFASIQDFAHALERAAENHDPVEHDAPTVREVVEHDAPTIGETDFHTMHSQLTEAEPRASQSLQTMNMEQPILETPPRRHKEKPARRSRQRIPRRSFLIASGGLIVAAGAGTAAWYSYTHRFPPQGTTIYTYPVHTDSITALAWKGERIVSASDDNTVQVWEATSGKDPVIYRQHTSKVKAATWSPDGQYIASGGDDGTVHVWEATSGKQRQVYKGHSSTIYSVSWSPDGAHIASGSSDGTVQIWEPLTGHPKFTYTGHQGSFSFGSVYTSIWSPNGTRIASGGSDNEVHVWNSTTGSIIAKYTQHDDDIYSLAWSADGKRIASASFDKTVRVWNVPENSSQQVTSSYTYTGHQDSIYSVSWSKDNQFIASASLDKTVQIWNPDQSNKAPFIYKNHHDEVWAVSWSDDSHRVASGGKSQQVLVWEAV